MSDLAGEHFSYIQAGAKSCAKGLPHFVDRDDIVGAVIVRMVKDSRRYDPDRSGYKNFVTTRMHGAVLDAVMEFRGTANRAGERRVIARYVPIKDRHLGHASFDTTMAADFVARALAEIPERWRSVLLLRFSEGRSGNEIGALLGVSRNRVEQILWLARRRLRAILKARGVTRVSDVI